MNQKKRRNHHSSLYCQFPERVARGACARVLFVSTEDSWRPNARVIAAVWTTPFQLDLHCAMVCQENKGVSWSRVNCRAIGLRHPRVLREIARLSCVKFLSTSSLVRPLVHMSANVTVPAMSAKQSQGTSQHHSSALATTQCRWV